MIKEEIQGKFLEHSNPNAVYDWMEKNSKELWFDDGIEVELMLLKRKEPLIDLALALFSYNEETRNILFDSKDNILQKAVLTNKECGYFPAVENLLKEENTEYLEILLTNTENRPFLIDLFKKQNSFTRVNKNYWLSLLEITSRNKILKHPYSKDYNEWGDDISPRSYATRLYSSVYGLSDILDVTDKNAELLCQLLEALPTISGFHFFDLDVLKMINKWQKNKSVQHSDFLYFYEHKNDFDTSWDKCWTEWVYIICRTNLANSIGWSSDKFNEFENSDDIALRLAFYRNNNFLWGQEHIDTFIENVKKYYEKDGKLFTENLIKNNTIYLNKEIREFVGSKLLFVYSDEYQERLKKLQEEYPESFIDNSQIESIESIGSKIFDLRNEVNFIKESTISITGYMTHLEKLSLFMIFLLVVFGLIWWL